MPSEIPGDLPKTGRSTKITAHTAFMGFPGGSDGKESCLQCRRPGFSPWVRKIPWRREWLPTPIFQGQRSLVGYSPWGHEALDKTEQLTHRESRKMILRNLFTGKG